MGIQYLYLLPVVQGALFVRGDNKIFRFAKGKSESLFLQRKNPRRIAWTVLYRRQHKKGISEVRVLASTASDSRHPPERHQAGPRTRWGADDTLNYFATTQNTKVIMIAGSG